MKLKKLLLLCSMSVILAQDHTISQAKSTAANQQKSQVQDPIQLVLNIGLSEENRLQMADALKKLLADNYVVYTKLQQFHWNVEGPLFSELHAFFQKLYEAQQLVIDRIAERIRALGVIAPGSLQEFLATSGIREHAASELPAMAMVTQLNNNYETLVQGLRQASETAKKLNDEGTLNMLADILEQTEKSSWMIRSYMKNVK